MKALSKNVTKRKANSWDAVLASLIVFIFLCCFNTMVPCMRSLPDEMGAVALAAKWVGYDWSYVLTHPEMYYGSGTAILLLPFFYLIKDPMILYQCLLGVAALLHALTAFIACQLILNYYKDIDSPATVVMIGVASALFTPTRSSNIDNEPMLVFLLWVIIYLIVALQHMGEGRKKVVYSIILACVLGISYLSHTRAIMYSIVAVIVIILYRILTKKMLVSVIPFGITYIVGMLVGSGLVTRLREGLFTNQENVDTKTSILNSGQALVDQLKGGAQSLFSITGIRSYLDMTFGNLWVTFIFSGGIIGIIVFWTFRDTVKNVARRVRSKKLMDATDIYFPMIYCVVGFLGILLALGITWLSGAIKVHTDDGCLTRGHFYLRYYGQFFGPLCLFFAIMVRRGRELTDKLIAGITGVYLVVAAYTMVSAVRFVVKLYKRNIDWFYYFAPFALRFRKWPYGEQDLSYFVSATVLIALFFIVFMCVARKRINAALVILILFLGWEYGYGVVYFDSPYSNSYNYYMSADAVYEVYQKDTTLFDHCDELYYYSEEYGPQYIVQFMVPDKKVVTDLTLLEQGKDNAILSQEPIHTGKVALDEGYQYAVLDENEYLYVNGDEDKEKLRKLGYELLNVHE